MKVSLILKFYSHCVYLFILVHKHILFIVSTIHIQSQSLILKLKDLFYIQSIIEFKFYSLVTFTTTNNKLMQHLNKVSDPTFSRKWTFDQNWNTVENTLLRENK